MGSCQKILTDKKCHVTYFCLIVFENGSQPFRPDSCEEPSKNNKNTVFNIYCVASTTTFFSFLSLPWT